MIKLFLLSFCSVGGLQICAQILPDLEGEDLYDEVVAQYKPNFVEVYAQARVLMYTEIYNTEDSVEAIYSGHKLYLPPTEESPIQFLAMNASPNGINTEHIFPRSKGARPENGNAFSDLHNLAPARWEVNEARSNFSFDNINDIETDCWYARREKLKNSSSLSNEAIKAYSEVDGLGERNGLFEPREAVKGDIARSVFYFYTMYRAEADSEDSNFFSDMQKTLCEWHNDDAVDSVEMDRNLMKAIVQDGKTNPFIMDCGLANRMYCPSFDAQDCKNLTTAVDESLFIGQEIKPAIKIFPNPNNGIFTLDISDITPGNYQVNIYKISGQLLYSLNENLDFFNSINMWNVRSGLHIIHIVSKESGRKYSGLFKVIK